MPKAKRGPALAQQVKLWNPFHQIGYFAVWDKGIAQVWLWDKNLQLEQMMAQQLAKPELVLVVPEVVMQAKSNDGLYLKSVSKGFELQCWQNRKLLATSWFSSRPASFQQTQFINQLKLEYTLDITPVSLGSWLTKPWAGGVSAKQTIQQWEPRLVLGFSLCFTSVLVFQAVTLARLESANARLEQDKELLNEQVSPVLATRQKALEVFSVNKQYLELISRPGQIALMVGLADTLPETTEKLLTWNYRPGRLEVEFEDKQANPQEYVKKFEDSPLFSQVRTEPSFQKNAIKIYLKVTTWLSN